MTSRSEEILTAISEGNSTEIEPLCRKEKFLKAIANGDTSDLPEPTCREEVLLKQIAENGVGTGVGTGGSMTEVNINLLVGDWETKEEFNGIIETLNINEDYTLTYVFVYTITQSRHISFKINGFNIEEEPSGYTWTYDPNTLTMVLVNNGVTKTFYKKSTAKPTIELITGKYASLMPEVPLQVTLNADGTVIMTDGQETHAGTYIISEYDIIVNLQVDGESVEMGAFKYDSATGYLIMQDYVYFAKIIPQGEVEITENGTHDITNYASAVVNVSALDLSATTATESDVREGKEFFNASGKKVMGTYKDMMQARIDSNNSCADLFCNYPGDNVDFIKDLDTSKIIITSCMFQSCSNLTTIPPLDTGSATNMSQMFQNCKKLTTIPPLDTGSAVNIQQMFQNCYELTTISLSDTGSVTNMKQTFNNCENLTTVSLLDMGSATNTQQMFDGCENLTTVSLLDTGSVTNMSKMFYDCCNLTTVSLLDMSSATSTSYMFSYCEKLTNLTLKNIKISLTIGETYLSTYGQLLTLESLLNTIKELHTNTGTSTTKLTVGSTNLEKLANVYVKLVDITDEMRAEDEYIDNKLPFVVCESTDEGAMHIIDEYIPAKNWTIA